MSGYRSFGDDVQRIGPFGKINLFIGKNNSGKSNIIKFIHEHYSPILTSRSGWHEIDNNNYRYDFNNIDYYKLKNFKAIRIEFGFRLEGKWHKQLIERLKIDDKPNVNPYDPRGQKLNSNFSLTNKLLKSKYLFDSQNIWFAWENSGILIKDIVNDLAQKIIKEEIFIQTEYQLLIAAVALEKPYNYLTSENLDIFNITVDNTKIVNLLEKLNPLFHNGEMEIPQVDMIPAIRKIGDAGTNLDDFSGIGIIDRLSQLQNPVQNPNTPDEYQRKKKKFEDINHFLRTVTNSPRVRIEIPHDKSIILVHMDDKIFPLSSLGTGIHEVIILAAAATVLENQVICMEEPELHLHPLLQKKLIRYLQENTNNQYFITTHSAHLLDTPNVAIFHVRNEDGQSIVESVTSNTSKFSICSDLGYKPSDLLQSNCIIWVEGPSDRIYLNYWIKLFDEIESLQEGIDYTIMFYGGSLISHLSASDIEIDDQIENEEITNFISLLKINRNTVIMCDSDKENDGDSLKPSPQRLENEFESEKFPGVWITHGREVENYLNPKIVKDAIKNVHTRSNCQSIIATGIYDYFWKYKTTNGEEKEADKVKIAKKIVEQNLDFEAITNPDLKEDLKKKIEELIEFIRESNHSESN